jgi:hypothetical protein
MSVRIATRELVERNLRFGAFYGGYLANHLPMALAALDAMGADDPRLRDYAQAYASRLEPLVPARLAIAEGAERDHLGCDAAFPAWVDYFSARIAARGAEPVLREWMDRLLAGAGSGAFHGLIRLAYATEIGSDRESAHALAYWAAAFQDLGPVPPFSGAGSPASALAAIARDPQFVPRRFPGRNIVERTAAAAADPACADLFARAGGEALAPGPLAQAMIRCYAASGNFTILHGVTGCHALRLVLPFAREPNAALAHFWHALAAAWLGAGSPAAEGWALEGSDCLGWDEIRAAAIACDDEHDVKFAYSCWREWQGSGDSLYRRAASARVRHALRAERMC